MAGLSPEAAARRGRTLLNLRCTEVEAGLLGRTLITLVNNKVGVAVTVSRNKCGTSVTATHATQICSVAKPKP